MVFKKKKKKVEDEFDEEEQEEEEEESEEETEENDDLAGKNPKPQTHAKPKSLSKNEIIGVVISEIIRDIEQSNRKLELLRYSQTVKE